MVSEEDEAEEEEEEEEDTEVVLAVAKAGMAPAESDSGVSHSKTPGLRWKRRSTKGSEEMLPRSNALSIEYRSTWCDKPTTTNDRRPAVQVSGPLLLLEPPEVTEAEEESEAEAVDAAAEPPEAEPCMERPLSPVLSLDMFSTSPSPPRLLTVTPTEASGSRSTERKRGVAEDNVSCDTAEGGSTMREVSVHEGRMLAVLKEKKSNTQPTGPRPSSCAALPDSAEPVTDAEAMPPAAPVVTPSSMHCPETWCEAVSVRGGFTGPKPSAHRVIAVASACGIQAMLK